MIDLIIGGVVVTDISVLSLSQSYDDLNKGTLIPMSDGTSVKIMPDYGEKMQTSISANGWMPPGLDGLDYTNPIVIDCVKQRSIIDNSNVITIPGIIRPDVVPEGFAIVGGEPIAVNSAVVANVATIDITANATAYQIAWLPRMTAYCEPQLQDKNLDDSSYTWSITGIETSAN